MHLSAKIYILLLHYLDLYECYQSGYFKNPQPIKETKIWMVNGKIDDASHAHICEEYGEKMKANGADIKVTTKAGWGHGFEG